MEQNDIYREETKALEKLSLQELEFNIILEHISKYTISELGKKIILETQLFSDYKLLKEEIEQVEELRQLILKGETIPFENIINLYPIIYKSKIEKSALSEVELYKVYELSKISRNIKSFVRARTENLPIIFQKTDLLIENKILEKHIEEAIDSTGNVKDSASRELSNIRKQIIEKSALLRNRLKKLVKKYSDEEYAREEFFSIRDGRFVIPIKVENKRAISGIIHGASQTGSTVFLEPSEIIELNNELSLLENEERREIYKILSNLTAEVRQNSNELIKSLEILSYIDALNAKAIFSIEFDGVKPNIVENNYLYLKSVKHPILSITKGKNKVIPMSLELTDTKRGLLISGPNAGGKTVALKTVGISLAMALAGIFPLGECTTNIREIFTYIGDNQSIQNDLSTFSAQILRIKQIINNAFPNALILIDEIGSGTDPIEGSAIASAVLETFLELKVFFLTTTHQSSLKTFALNREEIENASLEFDEKQLKPTYKFQIGVPGNSYAFSLAKSIGLSDLVLRRARKYLDNKQQELEKGIKLLQFYQKKSLQTLNEAQKERETARKLAEDYETKFNDFKKRKNELMAEARKEASKIFENANSLIERTIKEIREEQKQISEIKKDFEVKKKEIISIPVEEKVNVKNEQKVTLKNDGEITIGTYVKYSENNSIGKVVEIDNSKKLAVVEINGIKFKIKTKLLEVVSESEYKSEIITNRGYIDNIKLTAHSRLDLRGERVDVALRKVEEFISDAILSNIDMLTIIHGKGTGALREAIQEYLKYNQAIKSFRDGDLVEGGSGVTIVFL
ncbi:MAG: endonuclease MutS2 [Candidatus Kapaibacteriota bacterium]